MLKHNFTVSLALDQSEINRIIAEASKGSKFYENERKKDIELTEKIEKLIKKKEEIMKGVDLGKETGLAEGIRR